jgi:hypothetical protein
VVPSRRRAPVMWRRICGTTLSILRIKYVETVVRSSRSSSCSSRSVQQKETERHDKRQNKHRPQHAC